MRKSNTVAAEIVELNKIKLAYNHFLASFEAHTDVENYTLVLQNKAILSANLRKLYTELESARTYESRGQPQQPSQRQWSGTPQHTRMNFGTHSPTAAEERAIMHFNSDRRYRIRE